MKFMGCSMSTVLDPKNSLSQRGIFYKMVESGINILNQDFCKWEFITSNHFLFYFYISNQSRSIPFHLYESSVFKPVRGKGSAVYLLLLIGFPALLLKEYRSTSADILPSLQASGLTRFQEAEQSRV